MYYQLGFEYENNFKYQEALDNYLLSSKHNNPKAYIRLIIFYSKIEYYNEVNNCFYILNSILQFMKKNKLNYYIFLKKEYDKMLKTLDQIYNKNMEENALLLCNLSVI